MQGFLNINKPAGMTSFDVIRKLKKLFPRKTKLGHMGTLDPMATGVLPVAVGQATKLLAYIENESKEYIATMTVGGRSDTQDAWGSITYSSQIDFDFNQLGLILDSFRGVIKQIPPMYSAVHYQGKRLYELARQGKTVERNGREVEVKVLELMETDCSAQLPQLKFKIVCSKGTYIRTLCHDIGEKLGAGGFLSALQRSRTGVFRIEEAHTLQDIMDNGGKLESFLLAIDYPLGHLPAITVDGPIKYNVLNGGAVLVERQFSSDTVRVYSSGRELLAIARGQNQGDQTLIKPVRVFNY